ncbi:MAG: phosphotransferase family protein [Actinoallomurus sp.]
MSEAPEPPYGDPVPNELLPAAGTRERFDPVRRDETRLRTGVLRLCRRLGLGAATVTRFPGGSLPVYAVGGDLVLKLFPPFCREHHPVEERVLRAVEGRLPVPTPRVRESGEFQGWGYVLMTLLRGEPLTEAWPRLTAGERDRLAARLGTTLAALHEVDTASLSGLGPADWPEFLAGQRAGCPARQRERGLDEVWAERIPEFLESVPLPAAAPVLLHTEVMREHLLAGGGAGRDGVGRWPLSGLFDFEPAMLGAREYEFVAVGLFVAAGDARFLRRLLLAYGYPRDALDEGLQRRLLAYTLLHRYSDLPWYLERLPAPGAASLGALARRWWPL